MTRLKNAHFTHIYVLVNKYLSNEYHIFKISEIEIAVKRKQPVGIILVPMDG